MVVLVILVVFACNVNVGIVLRDTKVFSNLAPSPANPPVMETLFGKISLNLLTKSLPLIKCPSDTTKTWTKSSCGNDYANFLPVLKLSCTSLIFNVLLF